MEPIEPLEPVSSTDKRLIIRHRTFLRGKISLIPSIAGPLFDLEMGALDPHISWRNGRAS